MNLKKEYYLENSINKKTETAVSVFLFIEINSKIIVLNLI